MGKVLKVLVWSAVAGTGAWLLMAAISPTAEQTKERIGHKHRPLPRQTEQHKKIIAEMKARAKTNWKRDEDK